MSGRRNRHQEHEVYKLRPISDLLRPRKQSKPPDQNQMNDWPGQSMSDGRGALDMSSKSPQTPRWKSFDVPPKLKYAIKAIVACVVIPGLMAVVGVIVESLVYGGDNTSTFHRQWLAIGGLIAAPFILLRWCWLWPRHLFKLELTVYIIQTTMFLATVYQTMIDGQTTFHIGEHVRSTFAGDNYKSISTSSDVYDYLNASLNSIYDADDDAKNEKTDGARHLPGLLTLISGVRIKQHRTVPVPCPSSIYKKFGKHLVDKCYSPFSVRNEDKSDYLGANNATFGYVDMQYVNYAGHTLRTSDFHTKGQLSTYPLSGYWVVLPPKVHPLYVKKLFETLKVSNWLNPQTRMVSLDFAILAKDLKQPVFATVVLTIEVTPSGKYTSMTPQMSFSYLSYITSALKLKDTDQCAEVTTQSGFLLPIYLGVIPVTIYTLFYLMLQLSKSVMALCRTMYTYIELSWIAIVLTSIIYRWQSIYYAHCTKIVYSQKFWGSHKVWPVPIVEYLPEASHWHQARQMLAVALFLYIFDSLKFITKMASFDAVGKTLAYAFRSLASFALSFAVLLIAFVTMFYLLFSADDENYQSWERAFGSVWLIILGNVDLNPDLLATNVLYLPVIVIITFLLVFVLLTVIVAIVNDAFERIKIEQNEAKKLKKEKRESLKPTRWDILRRRRLWVMRRPSHGHRHLSSVVATTNAVSMAMDCRTDQPAKMEA